MLPTDYVVFLVQHQPFSMSYFNECSQLQKMSKIVCLYVKPLFLYYFLLIATMIKTMFVNSQQLLFIILFLCDFLLNHFRYGSVVQPLKCEPQGWILLRSPSWLHRVEFTGGDSSGFPLGVRHTFTMVTMTSRELNSEWCGVGLTWKVPARYLRGVAGHS